MTLTPAVADVIARVPRWRGLPTTTTFLAGGMTNQNYRVDVQGESFVVRISGANTELLGINRDQEHAATLAAAQLGVGPEVIDFILPEGYLVTRFISGRLMPPPELGQPENLRRVAATLRRIHDLPPLTGTFSPFRVVEAYDALARQHGVTAFPANYAWLRERMAAIEAAFQREPFTPRLCHNDLLNENFLLDNADGALRIIDWEYAATGDLFFDLANFAVNHGLSDEQDRRLLDAYFAPASERHLARHKLMRSMSDFREAMWALVQIGISKLDFDFQGYGARHFARLTAAFEDPQCAAWLATLNAI